MDFEQALEWLDGHVNLEATSTGARLEPPRLDRMAALVDLLADPQDEYPVIHLTGTNGKTSTARMVAALLQVAGLRVGMYTSPHLESITERLVVDGQPVTPEVLAASLTAVAGVVPFLADRPTYFELLTAAGFRWMAEEAVHAAVVEVGMLGTWDATNVADGQVAVITNVGSDHLDRAGSIEGVADEKAGIVKPGSTVVLGAVAPELRPAFASRGAAEVWQLDEDFVVLENRPAVGGRVLDVRTPGEMYHDLHLPLHGSFQGDNAAVAMAAVEAFLGRPLEAPLVTEALAGVTSPGRLEVAGRHPLVLLDGAHNPGGASALAAAVEDEFARPSRWTLVLGLLRPHRPADFLDALDLPGARVLACQPASPRAVPAAEVAAAATDRGLEAEVAGPVADALARALASAEESGGILVTGSLYTVGEARAALGGRSR